MSEISFEEDISQIGQKSQKDIRNLSDLLYRIMQEDDLDETTRLIDSTIKYIKELDEKITPPKKKLFIKPKPSKSLVEMVHEAERVISDTESRLRQKQLVIIKNKKLLEQVGVMNAQAYKEIEKCLELIRKETEIADDEIMSLENNNEMSVEDKMLFLEKKGRTDRLKKRMEDLCVSRELALQMISQLRILVANQDAIIDRLQSVLLTTIALWKENIAIMMGRK